MRSVALALVAAVVVAAPAGARVQRQAGPISDAAGYIASQQQEDGGFAEPGGRSFASLTAWAVIGLRAAGRTPRQLESARAYLARSERALESATDVELALVARAALGDRAPELVAHVRSLVTPGGRIGPTLNSTIWGTIALRAAGEPVPRETVRYLLRAQRPSGGWSWSTAGAPDSNDTAAAIQALRAVGVRGRPIARALRFLRRLQNRDGGFELVEGRGSDAQSTAWAIQAFVAAGERAPPAALRYLRRLQGPDGSVRYSRRYAATPVWVTAQALAALARKPLPLR